MLRPAEYVEEPAFFPAGAETLFGIVSRPVQAEIDVCVIALAGGGYTGTTTRYAPPVVMSRRLAERGYRALRFDYHGVGESTGDVPRFTLSTLFRADVEGAVRFAVEQDLGKIVLLGYCFGARTAMAAIPALKDVSGAVLLSPPLQDYDQETFDGFLDTSSARDLLKKGLSASVLRGLRDPERRKMYRRAATQWTRRRMGKDPSPREDEHRWISPRYLEPLRILAERRLPTLVIYGNQDDYYEDFLRARDGEVGRIVSRPGSRIDVETIDGLFHAFPKTSVREESFRLAADWLVHNDALIRGSS